MTTKGVDPASYNSVQVYLLAAMAVVAVLFVVLFCIYLISTLRRSRGPVRPPSPHVAQPRPQSPPAPAPTAAPQGPPLSHPNLVRSELLVCAFYHAAREEIKLRIERREQSTILGLTGIFVLLGTALARPWVNQQATPADAQQHAAEAQSYASDPSFWLANLACFAVLATALFICEHQRAVRYLQRYIGHELLSDIQPPWPPSWDESKARVDFANERMNPLGWSLLCLVVLSGVAALVIATRYFPSPGFDWTTVQSDRSRLLYGYWTDYKGYLAMLLSIAALIWSAVLIIRLYLLPSGYAGFKILTRP